nr:LicD family protein [uncultured Blautia sp.]
MNQIDATKKMQKIQLDILKDFQYICNKYNIPYFVSGGTAIGAIRHRGFIPWDDDIDVCVLREDYSKILHYIRKDFSTKYDVYDIGSSEGYVLVFAKMCKKGTCIQEAGGFDTCVPTGIGIDIFAYDKTTENKKKREKQIRDTWIWARMGVLSEYKTPQFPKNVTGSKLMLAKVGCWLIHYTCKILHLKKKYFYKKYMKAATRFGNSKEELYTDFSYVKPEVVLCTKNMIFPLQKAMFEDTEVNLLNGVDEYLTSQFGNYMKLPPENERKTHNPKFIDFGDGYIYRKEG